MKLYDLIYFVKENSLIFAVTVLMFLMWKIYKDESEIIEALLLE
ncbi:hypothetical protein ACFPM4_15335 [Lederbergia graminis]|uniref:Uncharacterized protein n=1 Tax=Lederbergia graminis TaxID=735518 RepID=A0ABW0LLG5_9BACI